MSLFTNYKEIAGSPERMKVLRILEAGVAGASAWELLSAALRFNADFKSVTIQQETFDLITGRIFVVGGGKAAGAMAEALERIIPPKYITAGLVNCYSTAYRTERIRINRSGHPLPDRHGVKGVEQMLALKEECGIGKKDLVICLISGGASAMLPAPAEGVSLGDKQGITELLMKSGADIQEINIVRKHLSRVKGGQLAAHFQPARIAALIISDVVGDTPEVVGSGPTVMDTSTFKDADQILDKYDLKKKAPAAVVSRIEAGARSRIPDTPKSKGLARNFVVGSNASALEAMAHAARDLGLRAVIAASDVIGNPGEAARLMATQIMSGNYAGYDVVLWGGETVPRLPAKTGQGGRNQHLAAVFMGAMQGLKGKWVLSCLNTDGVDYISGVGGAIIDQDSFESVRRRQIEYSRYIRAYDSYNLFKKMRNNLLLCGHTGTNVRDVMIFLQNDPE